MSNPLSSATSFETVANLLDIDNSHLRRVVIKDNNWIRFNRSPKPYLFKLKDVRFKAIVQEYSKQQKQAFSFDSVPAANVKLSFYLDSVQSEKMMQWYIEMFGNVPWKTAEEYQDESFNQPRKHNPIKATNNGDQYMQVSAPSTTTVAFEAPVDGKTKGKIVDFNYDTIESQVGDVFIRVNDVWKSNGCIGLKMDIVHLIVKNDLF